MSRNAKIVAGILGTVLSLCMGGMILLFTIPVLLTRGEAGRAALSAVTVAELAPTIADFKVPADYEATYSTRFTGFCLVHYDGRDDRSHITLFQAPSWVEVDEQQLAAQMREALPDHGSNLMQLKQVSSQAAIIRGQAVTLTINEGMHTSGELYRVVSGVFQGKSGPTLLTMAAPAASWDEAAVVSFLASFQ